MGYLGYLLFAGFVFLTVSSSEAQGLGITCPILTCPTCGYNYYHSYRSDWRGCQECYCEPTTTTPSATMVVSESCSISPNCTAPYCTTGGYYSTASWDPHPANYWSMSRSSLLSILLNLKQEAQSLINTAKNTYDHILHSVIVNDIRKRRAAAKEAESRK